MLITFINIHGVHASANMSTSLFHKTQLALTVLPRKAGDFRDCFADARANVYRLLLRYKLATFTFPIERCILVEATGSVAKRAPEVMSGLIKNIVLLRPLYAQVDNDWAAWVQ